MVAGIKRARRRLASLITRSIILVTRLLAKAVIDEKVVYKPAEKTDNYSKAERPEIPRNKALPIVFGNAFFAPGAEGIEPPPKVLETTINSALSLVNQGFSNSRIAKSGRARPLSKKTRPLLYFSPISASNLGQKTLPPIIGRRVIVSLQLLLHLAHLINTPSNTHASSPLPCIT